MALEKDIDLPWGGGSAAYHRILEMAPRYVPDPLVPKSIGTLSVVIGSFATAEARASGAGPLHTYTLLFRFGEKVADKVKGIRVDVIRSDEPTREDVYNAILRSPIFNGALPA